MPIMDIIIIAVIVLSAMVSFARGFFREAMSLIGWGVSIFAAYTFATDAAPYFEQWISDYTLRYILAAVCVFLVGLLVMGIVNYLVGHFILSIGVNGTDRILGVVLGLIRGVVIIGLLLWLMHPEVMNIAQQDDWFTSSTFKEHFDPLVEWLLANLESFASDWADKASGGSGAEVAPSGEPAAQPETTPSI